MSNIDKQTLSELRKRYTPPEIPKCSICGGELSIQRCGGGEPTVYACDGYEADPENPGMVRRAAGRDIADKHYEESRYIDWKKGGDSDVVTLLDELEAAEKRIAELEGELEVAQHDLSDTEDAMHIWAERAEKAESKFSVPVAYAPKGHIGRYLNGENSGCWVYGNPIGEDYDTLYMAAPNNSQHISRNTICEIAHGKCSRIPGATFYNAAEFALDEVYRAAAGKGE